MKKILLGTTALIGAALLASAASAESPKVTVGGFSDFQVGFANDDFDAAQRSYGFRNDNEINFSIDGVADSGLKYGAEIDLEADVTADADGEGLNAARTYLYLEGNWGRFELGSNEGSDQALKVDASNIARATGGIDGDFTYFNNGVPAVGVTPFIVTPDLPVMYGSLSDQGDETTNNNNKITYYTPRFSGFQLGLSFAPDQTDRGQTVTRVDTTAGQAENIISGGVNYEGQWDQIGLAASATGEWGNAEATGFEDLAAYALGAKISYAGFSLAGSWADWGDSLTTAVSNTDADYWTLGLAYDGGIWGVSATYLDSSFDPAGVTEHEFQNFVVGADYKLAPGLTPYVEASFFEYDPNGSVNDNDGYVFLVGSQLAF
jgi:outer membrane protein OmpU